MTLTLKDRPMDDPQTHYVDKCCDQFQDFIYKCGVLIGWKCEACGNEELLTVNMEDECSSEKT